MHIKAISKPNWAKGMSFPLSLFHLVVVDDIFKQHFSKIGNKSTSNKQRVIYCESVIGNRL